MKQKIKMIISIFVTAFVLMGMISACSGSDAAKKGDISGEDGLKIVTTIFPEYDLVRNIVGEDAKNVSVEMLLDNGVDLHSYQPTAQDIMNIANCDVFIYIGGESDKWVDDALEEAVNEDMLVINLFDEIKGELKEEETVEGMEAEDDEQGHAEDEGEEEYDEHVWLSLNNMQLLCEKISKALEAKDAANADVYEKNAKEYVNKLSELDRKYEEVISASEKDTLLFGDRFPFRYLTDDYGLDYYAAFSGCSAETEASFETVTFLARKVDELSLSAVIAIEGTDHRLAQTIIDNTKTKDQQIVVLDSMQSVTSTDVEEGADYLSIMEKNLEGIKQALN